MSAIKLETEHFRRTFLRRLGFVVAGLGLGLLAVEVLLRMHQPQIFPHHPPGMYTKHSEIGHVLTPAFDGTLERAEFVMNFRTNEAGLRGSETPRMNPDTIRILCLGDSFTWGMGVADSETYPARLEDLLRVEYPQLDIQVLNGGTPQYGSRDELAWLKDRGAELKPDFLILFFDPLDDFEQNRAPARLRLEFRDDMLWHRDAYAETIRPAPWRFLYWLKHRSHLVHLVSERVGSLAMRTGLLGDWEKASSSHFTAEESETTQSVLREISAAAGRMEAKTMFLFAPEKLQVLGGLAPPLRAARVIEEVAQTTDAAFVDLSYPWASENDVSRLFLEEGGHWTVEGNDFVASVLAHEIEDLGWLDKQPEQVVPDGE